MTPLVPDWCLAVATIIQEAENQPYEGKLAVAKAIRNRMRARYASKGTVASTVLWPYQFSGWNTGSMGRIRSCDMDMSNPMVLDAIRAWHESEHYSGLGDDVVLYHTVARPPNVAEWPPNWAKAPGVELVKQIFDHLFYSDIKAKVNG